MSKFFAIVPAAGSGSRMGSTMPKQYLPLLNKPVIWHALQTLCKIAQIECVYVVLARDDVLWETYDWSALGPKLKPLRVGGSSRAGSVANGLHTIAAEVAADDWVLVHDAARACLTPTHVEHLIGILGEDAVGGLLAVPVADTLKEAGAKQEVCRTLPRDRLWQAQTPQMFRYQLLARALAMHAEVTDEAAAIEALGLSPRLVMADITNFKLTYPQDLALAEQILRARLS